MAFDNIEVFAFIVPRETSAASVNVENVSENPVDEFSFRFGFLNQDIKLV